MADDIDDQQVVPGISVSTTGQATVAPALAEVLFDLALRLEEATQLPVDVEHALAAVVLAARSGELDRNRPLSADDPTLIAALVKPVKIVFADYDGEVGTED